MHSRQPSPRRSATPWRALLLALLLPVPSALAQAGLPMAAGPVPIWLKPPPPMPDAPAAPTGAAPSPEAPSRAPGAAQGSRPTGESRPTAEPAGFSRELQAPRPAERTASPEVEWSQPEEDFGRWERNTQQCEIELQEEPGRELERLPCRSVRLDQQLAGLLSIRFLPATRGRSSPAQLLLFAGVLLPESRPMRCQDSRCEPSWPIRVQLNAMATSNARTLSLPQARVVQGTCTLEISRVLCTARDREGRRWQAKAHW